MIDNRAKRTAKKFLNDRTGAAFGFFALAAVPIVASIGLATDVARGYMIKSRLTEAVDAASLAAGRQPDPALRQADAERFFWANFGENYFGATITSGPTAFSDEEAGTVTVVASAEIPTTFMGAVGFDDVAIGAEATVSRALNGMELMMVMDVTGSMGRDGKMRAMKDAASELLQILYGSQQRMDDVWVGVVPYVTNVNVGPDRVDWMRPEFDLNDYRLDPRDWTGCVIARVDNQFDTGDRTDDPPSVDPLHEYFWESDYLYYYTQYFDDRFNIWGDWWGFRYRVIVDDGPSGFDARGPNRGCVQEITPLTEYRDRVEADIEALEASGSGGFGYGGTATNMGLVWGWRALSPRWRGLWGGDTPASLPLDYDEPDMEKVVILLTDGFNMLGDNHETGYGKLSENKLGTTTRPGARQELNRRTAEICETVKARGIKLYTIVFDEPDQQVQDLMRNCASSPSSEHYFNSPTNEELVTNFKLIAGKLSKLRISE
ncbi:MAG: pilus assembly protein TadG-related protein [Pseudomonadota bacterium]